MNRIPLAPLVGLVVMGVAWLVPNHYLPWVAFHSEVTAAIGFVILAGATLGSAAGPIAWPRLAVLLLLLAVVPLLQAATGRIFFWGDAWIASLYLLGAALAVVTGHRLVRVHEPELALSMFWWVVLAGALASVFVALCQWLGLTIGLLAVDMRPGGRPFANLAQPNHLSTLLVLGMVAAFALAQRGFFGPMALVAILPLLVFGVAMTGSRAGWLQVGGLSLWLMVMHGRSRLEVPRGVAVSMPLFLVAAVLAWPVLSDWLHLSGGRTGAEQSHAGTRPIHWGSMVDALTREPLFGYGWNQVSVAQARVAADHAPTSEMIEHSHNLLLDLLVWNGLPIGLLVIAVLVWWVSRQVVACRNAPVAWLLAGVGVVLVHAMFEFPLEYAYFLLPVGLMMGMAQALSTRDPVWATPRWLTAVPATAALVLLTWTIVEYVELEETHRLRRFAAARIGDLTAGDSRPMPKMLTQQRAFLEFARSQARRGMSTDELEAMRQVAQRFGYPPVLLRYALAAALNGRPDDARETLQRLCKNHPAPRCREGQVAWETGGREQFPELRGIPFPTVPTNPARP